MKSFFATIQPRWQVVIFLMAGSVLNYADRAALSSVLPPLKADLGLTDGQLGLVGSVFLWSYALASPFAGTIADRYSRSRIVFISLILWSLVTALTSAVGGLLSLLALRIALGFTESLYIPAAIALTADHHGAATRGKAISLLITGMSLGVVLGGAGAGYLADLFGWRMGFWALGIVGVAFGLISRPLLTHEPPISVAQSAVQPSAVEALRYLARTPSYYVLLGKAALSGIAGWIFFAWLPLYYQETFDISLAAAGVAGTVMLQITGVLGTVVGGWASDKAAIRDTRRRMLMHGHGYMLAAPFLLIFIGQPSLTLTVIAVSAFSLFRGIGNANEQPIVCDVVPSRYRSTAIGLMNTCATAIGGTGVFVAGLLKQSIGLNAVFGWLSVAFIVSSAFLYTAYFLCAARDVARAATCEAASGPQPRGTAMAP
jgi:MFS transporter, Spinster family, sphingosine-1-phosphate transporter